MDNRWRSFTKALVWNLLGFVTMSCVGFMVTGSFVVGGAMALVNTCVGFVMYIGYERFWEGIAWGRV